MYSSVVSSVLKQVYCNDFFEIYIPTNSSNAIGHVLITRQRAYVYLKGDFYALKSQALTKCSREQSEFLLAVMTRLGEF